MNNYKDVFNQYDWNTLEKEIYSFTSNDVENVLRKNKIILDDFKVLISPAAQPYIEQMAERSHLMTKKRFGNTIQMYIPMYLSNECQNICTYCGFSMDNKIRRKTLSDAEIIKEAEYIKSLGYDHILLVTGEANRTVGVSYLKNAIKLIRPYFSNISIEVQPLLQEEYESLMDEGLFAVLVYQETYHPSTYGEHHLRGNKTDFEYRLDTPDRLAKAGIDKIGIGALIGLEEWRTDCFYVAAHLDYLERTYWQTRYSISFPRLRPCEGALQPKSVMTDKQLVQLICAYRLLNPEVELSLSTREAPAFRDNVLPLGITSMSAASKTQPGGYAMDDVELEQFEISDERSAASVEDMIRAKGFDPVWRDWHSAYSG